MLDVHQIVYCAFSDFDFLLNVTSLKLADFMFA